jgi:hypothetical protein
VEEHRRPDADTISVDGCASPRIVITLTDASPEACSIASASAAYIATVIALRRSGRARVIARTPSFLSTRTCSLIASPESDDVSGLTGYAAAITKFPERAQIR